MKTSVTPTLMCLTVIALLLAPAAFAGKVYKWIDRDGNVQYSAQKPSDDAQELNIHNQPTPEESAAEDEGNTKPADKNSKDAEEEKVKVKSKEEAAEIEKKNAEVRKKNCSISQKRLATINAGGRLFEVNEKGEHIYWDDATKAGKLAEAQASVDQWCSDSQ